MKTIELIRQAVARGWCHEQNKFKDLDVDLVNAIADEVSECIEVEQGKVDVLIDALNFYARPHNWIEDGSETSQEGGDKARQALAEYENLWE